MPEILPLPGDSFTVSYTSSPFVKVLTPVLLQHARQYQCLVHHQGWGSHCFPLPEGDAAPKFNYRVQVLRLFLVPTGS